MTQYESKEPLPGILNTLGMIGPLLALIGIAGCLFGYMNNRAEFWHSYMFGWIFWVNITLGCFLVTLLIHTVRATWGYPVLRLFEAGSRLIPVLFLLFLPVLAGLPYLYPWADHARVAADPVLQHRSAYMQPTWFMMRTIVYFAIWTILSTLVNQSSLRQDRTGDPNEAQWRTTLSAPGIVIYVITVTLAVTDWVMSLDPHWYSTIYGFIFCDGQALGALSLITLLVTWWAYRPPYTKEVILHSVTRDLGNLMLTFTMVWAYFALSQWLIIWSGNLPEEIHYYLERLKTPSLLAMGTFLVFGQFFIPFLLLLSSRAKRTPKLLAGIAAWIVLVRIVDIFWIIKPMFKHDDVPFTLWDVVAFVGIGGIWLTGFVFFARANALFPRHALLPEEALEHA